MRGANKVAAENKDKRGGKQRVHHAGRKTDVPIGNRAQNLNSRKLVGSKQGKTSGQIQSLDDGLEDRSGKPVVRRPIEQAIINWKKRQSNAPWWWLSFSTVARGNLGVCVVQGWMFLDAVNRANSLGVSVPGAMIYGEELSDMASMNENMTDVLLSEAMAVGVFKSGAVPVVMTEKDLYKAKEDEVKFRSVVDEMTAGEEAGS